MARRVGWTSPAAAAQAEAEVARADEHIARLCDLAERGALAEANDALMAAGELLRRARPLHEVAAGLCATGARLERLAEEVARNRAAVEGIELP
jgi:hypothetical protein